MLLVANDLSEKLVKLRRLWSQSAQVLDYTIDHSWRAREARGAVPRCPRHVSPDGIVLQALRVKPWVRQRTQCPEQSR